MQGCAHVSKAGLTHGNALLKGHVEQVDHSCPHPGASGAQTLLCPGTLPDVDDHVVGRARNYFGIAKQLL
jgi:hypothetical protein